MSDHDAIRRPQSRFAAGRIPVEMLDDPEWQQPTLPGIRPQPQHDAVNHPAHYTQHPSGVEAIQITEHMNFCLGNATKYIWRAGLKSANPIEDLKKARWYIEREIARLEKQA